MRHALILLFSAALATPAWALYKVVGPDGRITYTDTPPVTDTSSRVAPFRPGHSTAEAAALPLELRQPMQRYPVVLYTGVDCIPCDSARQLLLQRGVPFSERRVVTEDDARAYDKLGGARTLPGLGIGEQQLRGLNTADWVAYLDAAGYPKESRLPKGWKAPAATPLAEARAPAAAPSETAARESAAARRPAPTTAPAAPAPSAGSGTTIRF
ncbi:MAG: glutaredoxin family protein [Rubrivivax sp.]|nr:glutaredoxin family protein [Rubrivivax sp.]